MLELDMGRFELSTSPLPRLGLDVSFFVGAMPRVCYTLDLVVAELSAWNPPSPDEEPITLILIGLGTPLPPADFNRGGFELFCSIYSNNLYLSVVFLGAAESKTVVLGDDCKYAAASGIPTRSFSKGSSSLAASARPLLAERDAALPVCFVRFNIGVAPLPLNLTGGKLVYNAF